MKDRYQRSINYLRISLTERCNLRCQYCMPKQGIIKREHSEILTAEEFFAVAEAAVSLGVQKIRLTGGEPLLYKGIVPLAKQIGALAGLTDFTLTTNAILLKPMAATLKKAGITRLNISLDTLNPEKYHEITRGGHLQQVLDGIEEARRVGFAPIKINTVLMGGWNDDEIADIAKLVTGGLVDELRFIELMPIGETQHWAKERFVSNEIVIDKLQLTPTEGGSTGPAEMYTMPNGGRIGLIHPVSHKFCSNCNRLRLTADGKLKPCLLTNDEYDLRAVMRSGGSITDTLQQVILEKPEEHHLERQDGIPNARNMSNIGG